MSTVASTSADTTQPSKVYTQADTSKPMKVDTLGHAFGIFVRNTSPLLLLSTMSLAWTLKVVHGAWSFWDLAVGLAIFALWPVQEWLIHVFVLHFRPRKVLGRNLDFLLASKHRAHHRTPWDVSTTWIPTRALLTSLPLVIPAYLAAAYLLVDTGVALSALAIYLTFGVVYEWTHFLTHVSYKPKSRLYRRIWKRHRLHHFKSEHYWYGVSRLGGDWLLGTQPDPKTVDKSPTCKDLDASFAQVSETRS